MEEKHVAPWDSDWESVWGAYDDVNILRFDRNDGRWKSWLEVLPCRVFENVFPRLKAFVGADKNRCFRRLSKTLLVRCDILNWLCRSTDVVLRPWQYRHAVVVAIAHNQHAGSKNAALVAQGSELSSLCVAACGSGKLLASIFAGLATVFLLEAILPDSHVRYSSHVRRR